MKTKNNKNIELLGLGYPLTDKIRKRAFTGKRLNKGWFYPCKGWLSNGETYFYVVTNDPYKDKENAERLLKDLKHRSRRAQEAKDRSEYKIIQTKQEKTERKTQTGLGFATAKTKTPKRNKKTTDEQIPKTLSERRDFLKRKLQKFKGKSFICPALSNALVWVTANSIKEITEHASKKAESTEMALHLDKAIKNAVFVKTDKPKKGTQSTRFKFIELYILNSEIKNVGKAKLTIGMKKTKEKIQYCITAK